MATLILVFILLIAALVIALPVWRNSLNYAPLLFIDRYLSISSHSPYFTSSNINSSVYQIVTNTCCKYKARFTSVKIGIHKHIYSNLSASATSRFNLSKCSNMLKSTSIFNLPLVIFEFFIGKIKLHECMTSV